MKTIVCNAFSLQMVPPSEWGNIKIEAIEPPNADELQNAESAVGHADTAAVLGVKMNRCNVVLRKGDTLLVAQLMGGRLPEGATNLPEGFSIKWARVSLM